VPLRRALALWLLLFGAYAAAMGVDAAPGSRYTAAEAHVLLTARSLASDASADLSDEYRDRAWQDWYPGTLIPSAGSTNGRLLEPQGLAFPLLVAPALELGGPTGVELWLAAVTAVGFVLAMLLARRLVPDPWATGAVVVTGLSPPVLAAATTVGPGMLAGTLLVAAALLALRARAEPRLRWAFWCAALVAVLPWLGVQFALPAAVVAVVLATWLKRRQRGLAGFVALEVVLTSAVVYLTTNDRLFGGPTPHAARLADDPPTGAAGLAGHAARVPRLLGLWLDRDAGLLRWAPMVALAGLSAWLLWRSRRERIAIAVPERADAEVAAGLLLGIVAAVVAVAAFAAPALHGDWLVPREVAPALPALAALAAWGFRHAPRAGAVLAALTLIASGWLLLAGWFDAGAGIAPPTGTRPWGGVERVLPRFGGGGGVS
jgi:hypothetical protein